MHTKCQKYFVATTPKSYAKIVEIAQSAELVIVRETQEKSVRKNYRLTTTPGANALMKWKEALTVTMPTPRKKEKAAEQQSNREVNLMYPVPQSTLRDRLAKTYTFDQHMAEEIYDVLQKEGKI